MKKYQFILIPLLAATTAFAQNGHLKGRVYDTYTQVPLANAKILSGNKEIAKTDANGAFDIAYNQSLELTIEALSYQPYHVTVTSNDKPLQINLAPSSYNLNEVAVSSSKKANNLKQAQAIAILTRQDLTRNDGIFLENSLNLISGVRMEKRTGEGGQRITIRGYGNGSSFSGTGIKAYLNGIPVTDAEGNTIMDDIDFSTLGQVEVIKGPASSLYGTGIGGVLKMYTLKPQQRGTQVTQETMAGSYGLFRTNTRLENSTDNASIMINYGHQNYDNYRVHSGSRKDFVSFVGDFRANEKETFSTFASYSYSNDQLAGQLDSASLQQKLNIGEAQYLANDAFVSYESYRVGMSHNYLFSNHINNVTSGYVSGYKQGQAYATGLISNMAMNYGARTEFGLDFAGNKISTHGIFGGEFQKTNALKNTYGLRNDSLQAQTTDLETSTMQYSIFTQWDVNLPYQFVLTAGASANFIEFGITDRLANAGNPTHKDQSGYKSFDPVVTPRIALQRSFGKNISVYANVSGGYTPPTTGQVVIPQIGQVNTDLKPEKAMMYEVGTKGNLAQSHFSYQVALFHMDIQDKLTTQAHTTPSGSIDYTFTTNAGTQVNNGLELDLAYTFQQDRSHVITMVRPFVSYTYSDFTYKNFKSDNNNDSKTIDYSGNKAAGVPPHLFNAGIDFATKWGVYLTTTFQYVDKEPLTFDNQHYANAYSLLQAKLGYKHQFGKHFMMDAYAGAQNLTNSVYYTLAVLNSNYSGAAPKVFLPGPYNSTFYGGLNISYKF
ncbi:TonB-dependent receptor [Taibaiella soli]|uniref:TonB-dependent receptor n=1 Tax=Taibaiella soli TaxID=1649169 RepID=A0A2W2AG90_9BACT|nr:TonB-dependent receptor [Taibaiella soli]PZF72532.1 TonB-dependent receptor [Taibaiella soli]